MHIFSKQFFAKINQKIFFLQIHYITINKSTFIYYKLIYIFISCGHIPFTRKAKRRHCSSILSISISLSVYFHVSEFWPTDTSTLNVVQRLCRADLMLQRLHRLFFYSSHIIQYLALLYFKLHFVTEMRIRIQGGNSVNYFRGN